MATRREYAISLGLAQPTRGRMSREAHAAIAKAESEGMTFTDSAPTPKPRTVPTAAPVARVSRSASMDVGEHYEVDAGRYARTQMFKGQDSSGKVWKVNATQACKNCRYSLSHHQCNDPQVLVSGGEWISVRPV